MIEGAVIGLIVAIIMIFVKKNQEKKAISKVLNDDVIDQPDFVAFFHFASEATFLKKGFKFFDSNGVLTLHGHNLIYRPNQKGKPVINVDIKTAQLRLAPEKRKMKWLEINDNGNKYYFTTFSPGAFSVDKSKMDEFLKIIDM
jgi:hypothetical protein